MKSNYKRLGDYIVPCDEKNTGNIIKKLQGISNQKYFQKSHTNTIGVDLEKYRIVRTGQFAFNRATTRNGEKISIALSKGKDCIVSPSYRIFKSKDENVLNSEYLMMWFKRPEFDRFARFKSHGSAHEFFDYGEMCEVEFPIPNIEKQREIVREYNTIQNRIALNNQLISKLEETAQAIYKQWFANHIELGNLPDGWEMGILEDLVEFKNGKSKPKESGLYPVYGGNGIIEFVNEYNNENVIPIGRVGAYCGSLYRELGKCWISDNAIAAKSKINCNMFTYYLLSDLKLNERSEGTGQPLITQSLLNSIVIPKPKPELICKFEKFANKLFAREDIIEKETQKLEELKDLLLAKMTRVES